MGIGDVQRLQHRPRVDGDELSQIQVSALNGEDLQRIIRSCWAIAWKTPQIEKADASKNTNERDRRVDRQRGGGLLLVFCEYSTTIITGLRKIQIQNNT
jgi:hypothetical protein